MRQGRRCRHRMHSARLPTLANLAWSHARHIHMGVLTHNALTEGHSQIQKCCLRGNMSSRKQSPISSAPGIEKALGKKNSLLFLTEPIIPTGVTWVLKRKSGTKGSPLGAVFPESRSQGPPRAQSSLQVVLGWLSQLLRPLPRPHPQLCH